MSGSQVVDGKTGELIGGNYNYITAGPAYATSTYVPATSYQYTQSNYNPNNNAQNIYYGGNTGYTTTSVVTGGNQSYAVGGQVQAANTVVTGGQVVGTTVNTGKEVIKGESRIQYVPFEKKIVEYKDQAKVERVPKKVKKVEYREERKIQTIPKEVTVTDYYAVEYLRQYIPQYVPEKRVEYVQVPKKQIRYEYIPVERQIVHYPEQPLEVERVGGYQTQQTTSQLQGGQQYTTGQTYTTTTVQPSQEKVAYSTNTAISGNNIAYSTAPQYTYEAPVGERATYTTNPGNVSYTTQQYTTYETPQYTYETVPVGSNYVVSESAQPYSESYGYPTSGNYEYGYTGAEYKK